MNKQKLREIVKIFTKNKTYQFLVAIFISVCLAYVSWYYLISKSYIKRISLERSIKSINVEELKKEISSLKVQRQGLIQSYKNEQNDFKKLESIIYQTHYPIVVDILDKINSHAFNIHSYTLSKDMSKMSVGIEGSYQNLIRLIDFLGSIPATVTVSDYKITLSSDDMMVIILGLEVAPIRI